MSDATHSTGIVYSSTIVHANPAPYQIALLDFADGSRRLVRLEGATVAIGDAVERVGVNQDVFRRKV